MIDAFNTTRTQMLYSTKSCVILLFGVLALWNACPMECNAYFIGAKPIPLGSAKSKKEKPKTLRSLRLCGEQFFIEDPFRGGY
jgi:hypothetical protein